MKQALSSRIPKAFFCVLVWVSPFAVLASCSMQTYSGRTRGPEEVARIEFHAGNNATITTASANGVAIGVFANTAEVLPGPQSFSLEYSFDETNCDPHYGWCEVKTHHGECSGTINALAGKAYLVSLSQKYANVALTVSPKGYFDLTNRDDEPNPGSGSCKELRISYSSGRDITTPSKY